MNLFFRPAEKTFSPTGRKKRFGPERSWARWPRMGINSIQPRVFFIGRPKKTTERPKKNVSALGGLGPSPATRIATDLVFVSAHLRPRNAQKRYDFKGFWSISVSQSRCTHLTTSERNPGSQKLRINSFWPQVYFFGRP